MGHAKRVESEVAGCPAWLEIGHARLEPPAGARNREISYCESTKKPATSDSFFSPFFFLFVLNSVLNCHVNGRSSMYDIG